MALLALCGFPQGVRFTSPRSARLGLAFVAAGAVLVLADGQARATQGIYFNAFGARSTGMAGATLASGDDAMSQITNPANLGWAPPQIDLGLAYLRTDINFQNRGTYGPGVPGLAGQPFANDANNSTGWEGFPFSDNNVIAPLLAGSYRFADSDLHAGPLWLRNLSFGASLHALGGDAVRLYVDHPVLGPDTLARTNIAVTQLSGSLAYRFGDWLSLGATVEGLGGRMRLAEPVSFPVDQVAGGSTPLLLRAFFTGTNTFGDFFQAMGLDEGTSFTKFSHPGIDLGVGGRFGLTVKPEPWLSIAIAYQTPRKMTFKGHAQVDFTGQIDQMRNTILTNPQNLPFVTRVQDVTRFAFGSVTPETLDRALALFGIDPSLGFVQTYVAQIPFTLPQQVDVGFAVRPMKRVQLELDYSWINWSRAFSKFQVKFRNGTNPNINTLAGSPDVDFSLPINWNDQHIVRFGASWAASDRLTLRAGYAWGSEPITSRGAVLTIPAAGFQTVALGGSYRLSKNLGASLALTHAFRSTIRVGQSDISSFQAHSRETTSEWNVQAQLEWHF